MASHFSLRGDKLGCDGLMPGIGGPVYVPVAVSWLMAPFFAVF